MADRDTEEGDQFWHVAGISDIQEKSGSSRVRIPDRLFREENIIDLDEYVNWHYNKVTGVLIIVSDQFKLEKEDYEYTGEKRKFSEGKDGDYRTVVPKVFFESGEGVEGTGVDPEYKDLIQLSKDEYLYFIYNQDMASGETKSCYVLTEEQYSKRFSDSSHWDGRLEEAPKFFS